MYLSGGLSFFLLQSAELVKCLEKKKLFKEEDEDGFVSVFVPFSSQWREFYPMLASRGVAAICANWYPTDKITS